ncbi:MAG: DNA replication/repair protein RecF [Proteobacteria bacterium]|nr:DNA replication/repair protein RecF [Pseudomonadota bacterium]
MRLARLHIENLRNIVSLDVDLAPGLNVFVGANGAGKSSVLEAAYLLSHAQSFRTGLPDELIRNGQDRMAVAADIHTARGERRIALVRDKSRWHGRIDQADANRISDILRASAVFCFEPGSHEMIAGGGKSRRRFLDWGVFHVEHRFLDTASRYRRILQQRNAALKGGAAGSEIDAWDRELARAAQPMDQFRSAYMDLLRPELAQILARFLPELGKPALDWQRGWPEDEGFLDHLASRHGLDRARGHTTRGPHRADWRINFALAQRCEQLSRGQQKLCAMACMLAQSKVHARVAGEWPVVMVDDLGSELDSEHQARVLECLQQGAEQVLVSGVEIPESVRRHPGTVRVFHVEHGSLRGLL